MQQADRKMSSHHQSLVTLSRKTSVVKALTEEGLIPPNRGVSPSRSHSPGSDLGKVNRWLGWISVRASLGNFW